MKEPYFADTLRGLCPTLNGKPAVFLGSEFICEARDMLTAEKIAAALNAAEGRE